MRGMTTQMSSTYGASSSAKAGASEAGLLEGLGLPYMELNAGLYADVSRSCEHVSGVPN